MRIEKEGFKELVEKIENIENLKELKEIGKELLQFESNGYKRAVLEIYKEKKETLIKDVINNKESLRIIKNMILFGNEETRKFASRLIYALGEEKVYDSTVVSYLLELYKQSNGNGEVNGVEKEENA
ncbi:MAG: hypothetical protein DRP29_00045 [Thermodesulfobacteriota bacterium]|nr:MAG: hypothetical protein DRP29_00045 [Thermodesulfobacteriota bacterium]